MLKLLIIADFVSVKDIWWLLYLKGFVRQNLSILLLIVLV